MQACGLVRDTTLSVIVYSVKVDFEIFVEKRMTTENSNLPSFEKLISSNSVIYSLTLFVVCVVCFRNPDTSPTFVVGAGLVLAAINLSAAWAVLAGGSYLQRLFASFSWLAGVGMGGVFGLFMAGNTGFGDGEIAVFITPMPLTWTVAQIPFWLLRLTFGWQLVNTKDLNKRQPTSIVDLIAFTTLVGVSFAALQFTPTSEGRTMLEDQFWFVIPVALISFGFCVLFACPIIWLLLRETRTREHFPAGYLIAFCYIVIVLALTLSILAALAGPNLGQGGFFIIVITGSFVVFFSVPLLIYRDAGLRLWTRGTRTRRR